MADEGVASISVTAKTWQLEADPAALDGFADRWRSSQRTATTTGDGLLQSARRAGASWQGEAGAAAQSNYQTVVSGLDKAAGHYGTIGTQVAQVSSTLRTAQRQLSDGWARLSGSGVPSSVNGGTITFQPRTDAESSLVQREVQEATEVRAQVSSGIRGAVNALRGVAQDLQAIDPALARLAARGRTGGPTDKASRQADLQRRADKALADQQARWRTMKPGSSGTYRGILPGQQATDGNINAKHRYVVYDDQVKVDGTLAWRANNPGNLVPGPFSTDHGAIGRAGADAVFPDQATGDAAQQALLTGRYGNSTIAQTIQRYAPPSENNTQAYIQHLGQATGINVNGPTINQLTQAQFTSLLNAMHHEEGIRAGTTVPLQR
ncbi:MAG: hypothetical protein J2P15_10190 [Micromonosporaceae bacterium]|nr:hypothetical protein [Micromonosporaceae bacterium]